jgi:predicted ribosome quality control (RQC) complex YloA/Tae2 family protein
VEENSHSVKQRQKLQETIDSLQNDKSQMRQVMNNLEIDMKERSKAMDDDRDVLKHEILKYQTLIEVMQKASDASEKR